MKKYLFTLFSTACLLLVFSACETLPPVTDGSGSDGGTNTDDSKDSEIGKTVNFCDDGTLNCHVDVQQDGDTYEEFVTINEGGVTPENAFEGCFERCLQVASQLDNQESCNLTSTESCDTAVLNACSNSCQINIRTYTSSMPASDPYGIPENAKGIYVKVKSCLDHSNTTFQFKGPSIATRKFNEGPFIIESPNSKFWEFILPSLDALDKDFLSLPYKVGQHPECTEDLKGQIKLEFRPHKAAGEVTYTVNGVEKPIAGSRPFSGNVDTITREWKAPHLTTFQIPSEFYSELDVSQITWMVGKMKTLTRLCQKIDLTSNANRPEYTTVPCDGDTSDETFAAHDEYDFNIGHYLNGGGYGDTIVNVAPAEMIDHEFEMLVLIKSSQE